MAAAAKGTYQPVISPFMIMVGDPQNVFELGQIPFKAKGVLINSIPQVYDPIAKIVVVSHIIDNQTLTSVFSVEKINKPPVLMNRATSTEANSPDIRVTQTATLSISPKIPPSNNVEGDRQA